MRLISAELIWLDLSRLDRLPFVLPLITHDQQQRQHCARCWTTIISMQILHFIQLQFHTHTFADHCALPISHFHCRLRAACSLHTLQRCWDFSYFNWSAACNWYYKVFVGKHLQWHFDSRSRIVSCHTLALVRLLLHCFANIFLQPCHFNVGY